MKISVIIPVFNEQQTVNALLDRVQAVPVDKEIIIVDDGSTDNTRSLLKNRFPNGTPGVRLLFAEKNAGKGVAIREGLRHASGDLVLIQDADLEYDPSSYTDLMRPFEHPDTQVVYGSRFLNTTFSKFFSDWLRVKMGGAGERRYLSTYLGIKLLNAISRLLYGLKTTDEATCYKVFRTPLLKGLDLKSTGFEFCSEVTAKIGRRRIPVSEVAITYHPRTFEQGKKLNVWRDGFGAIWTLIKYRFRA